MTEIARGLQGVVLTKTRLSRVDGEAGELTIAGFPLEELAPNASFEETLHLLWHDRLPTGSELEALRKELAALRELPPVTVELLRRAAEAGLEPMEALRMGADTLSLVKGAAEGSSQERNLASAKALASRAPAIIATYWRLRNGQDPLAARPDLGHSAHFLYQLSGQEPAPARVRGLETYLNSVVDHGMNASTFTARVIVSTGSDIISAVVGAIGALKGPLHGGAPGPALDSVFMLRESSQGSRLPLAEVAANWARETVEGGERIMGFGHRVYRVRDPRADVLGAAAQRLFERAGDMALYRDARIVERAVLEVLAELKPGRHLKTNVEFYTALLLHGVGLEAALFSSVFAMARIGGWTAHVLEQEADDILIRPRAQYAGPSDRKWLPLAERQ